MEIRQLGRSGLKALAFEPCPMGAGGNIACARDRGITMADAVHCHTAHRRAEIVEPPEQQLGAAFGHLLEEIWGPIELLVLGGGAKVPYNLDNALADISPNRVAC